MADDFDDAFEGGTDDQSVSDGLVNFANDTGGSVLSNWWGYFTQGVSSIIDDIPVIGTKITGDHPITAGGVNQDGGSTPSWADTGSTYQPTDSDIADANANNKSVFGFGDSSDDIIFFIVAAIIILVLVAYITREAVG